MIFKLSRASDFNFKSSVEIKTIEELMEFIRDNGKIILNTEEITIYDSWVE